MGYRYDITNSKKDRDVILNISNFLRIFFRRALILLYGIWQWIDEYDYDYGDFDNDDDDNETTIIIMIMGMMRTMTMIVIMMVLTVLREKILRDFQIHFCY